MKIIEKLLTVNEYSRPGRPLSTPPKAVILHWTGAPMQKAMNTWQWFEAGCPKEKHYSSAHYIIDLNGDIYHAVPDSEMAYHCGSTQKDPKSAKIYTDWARAKFGKFAENPALYSPNNCTVGIELCTLDGAGNFAPETLSAAIELVAWLLQAHGLTEEGIGTHNLVVGWKDCPRLWMRNPGKFADFKAAVGQMKGKR